MNVASSGSVPTDAVPRALLRRSVLHVLASEGIHSAEISVTVMDDADIRALNESWLAKGRPTDVLAFSLGNDGPVLGDIYLGVEEAGRNAETLGVPFEEEMARLAIHGTLHVLGYDHPEGADREGSAMYGLQERLLQELLAGD